MHENFKEIEAGLSETVNLIRLAREKQAKSISNALDLRDFN